MIPKHTFQAADTYRQFWLATAQYDSPTRFGYDWFLSAIDKLWDVQTHTVNWLDFEQFTCDVLASPALNADQKVTFLKEGIDAFTRRGHFPGNKL